MLKKLLAALLAASMMAVAFAGCSGRGDTNSEAEPGEELEGSGVVAGEPGGATTVGEATKHNQQIGDEDINLVQFDRTSTGDTLAVITTTEGEIHLKLFPEQAPKAVENFTKLAEEGYYNGVTFHRVVSQSLIQGGDPTGTGAGGESIYAYDGNRGEFENETSLDLWHFRGALAMANTGADTNTSQFYIVQRESVNERALEEMRDTGWPAKVVDKYEEVGGLPHLDTEYTVFGMVMDEDSMEVVDKISNVPTDENDQPVDPVLIESVMIEIG